MEQKYSNLTHLQHISYDILSTPKVSFVCMNDTPKGTPRKTPHRGEVVRRAVDNSGLTIEALSRKTGKSRSTLYRNFDEPDMDWQLISSIGHIIGHNFSEDFPELKIYLESTLGEQVAEYGMKETDVMRRLYNEIDRWKTEAYANSQEAHKWKDLYYAEVLKKKK